MRRKRQRQCDNEDVDLSLSPDSYRIAMLVLLEMSCPSEVNVDLTPAHVSELGIFKKSLAGDAFKVFRALVELTVPNMFMVMMGAPPDGDWSGFYKERFRDEAQRIELESENLKGN